MKHSKPKIQYPALKPNQIATIERPECGTNKGKPQLQPNGRVAPARVTRGVFQLTRLAPVKPRSKYDPNTEAAKHGKIQ
jgi:hypothetical protein